MALDFPNSPALGATYSSGSNTWKWDGIKWVQIALAGNPLIVASPIAASWTQRNFVGTTSLTDVANGVLLKETLFQSGDALRAVSIVSPTPPYTIDATFNIFSQNCIGAQTVELGWTDGTKYHVLEVGGNGAGQKAAYAMKWPTAGGSTIIDANTRYEWSALAIYARIIDDGTNVSFWVSIDGINFASLFTTTKASGYLGSSGYTNVMWGLDNATNGAGNPPSAMLVVLLSWRVH